MSANQIFDESMMTPDQRFQLLSAYIDGEVSETEEQLVETWLSDDPNFRLLYQQQIKLRAILDGTELGNVIMTTNNIHNIDKPLADRFDVMEFPPITADNWRSKVNEWLSEAEVLATDEAIDAVLETSNGTIRDLKRGVEDIICEYK
jgi:DNA polymerase III delta prime subunit